MEQNTQESQISPLTSSPICPICHQPVVSTWYFCPNCGAKLKGQEKAEPLSTTVFTQTWIYAFSILLPVMCFLLVTKWPGVKYYKSDDPKAKQIGQIAWALIIISTIITIWLAYVWTQSAIQSSLNSVNLNFGGS